MSPITIDGETYDVPVINIKRKADFLDRYAERVVSGELRRSLIGVYYNYSIAFGTGKNRAAYHQLWDKLTEPVAFHTVTVPDEDGNFTFAAYFSGVSDEFVRVLNDGSTRWMKTLVVNFIAQKPARTP